MERSKDIILGSEKGSSLPVVVGKCPSCGLGDRSLVLVDFKHNKVLERQKIRQEIRQKIRQKDKR